jgi:hypothetical protein
MRFQLAYIDPQEVISPKAHWHLFDVILDRREGNCAYALGTWDGERRMGFRWNGSGETGPIGNPQSRGLPTWTILDPALHEGVIALLSPEKQVLARRFFGLRSPAEWQNVVNEARKYHVEQVAKIASESPPVASLGKGTMVMHVIPFSAVDTRSPQRSENLFQKPDRFPPIGDARPRDSKIDLNGLITGSNASGLSAPQRAYVRVSRAGIVESVVSSLENGRDQKFLVLPHLQAIIIKYAQIYSASLNTCGISCPMVILVSLVGVKDMRLIQNFVERAFPEDLPYGTLEEEHVQFSEAVFETVPAEINESAKMLSPLLTHIANAAGMPSSPYFDGMGNYLLESKLDL